MMNIKEFLIRLTISVILPFAFLSHAFAQAVVTDYLDAQVIGPGGGSYQDYEDIKCSSGSVYANRSSRGMSDNHITMSATKEAGTVTTQGVGFVRRFLVEWAAAGSLLVYVKDTPYSSVSDLYDTKKQGKLVATLNFKTGGEALQEIEIQGDYEYIGFRPEKNSMSFSSFSIVRETKGSPIVEQVSAPKFNLDASVNYTSPQSLEISCDTLAATIYYTLDGKEPTTESAVYNEPIILQESTTVKAFAVKEGLSDSPVTSATFNITSPSDSYTYRKVNSLDKLRFGDVYLIVREEASQAMGWQDTNKRRSVAVSIVDDCITLPSDYIATLETADDKTKIHEVQYVETYGRPAFYDVALKGYLSAYNAEGNLGDNYLRTEFYNRKDDHTSVSVSFDDAGNAIIDFEHTKEGHYRLLYNSDAFSCFYPFSTLAQSVQLYRREPMVGTFNISSADYATFYIDKAFRMPQGVTGGIILSDAEKRITVDYRYPEGSIVPAGTGLLLKAKAGEYVYECAAFDVLPVPQENLLHGEVDADGMTFVEGASKYYKLSYSNDGGALGFYWDNPDGGPFKNGKEKAYLALSSADMVNVQTQGFSLNELGDITGVSSVSGSRDINTCVYRIDGRRVQGVTQLPRDLNFLSSGVYIVGGRKVIIR